MTKEIEAMLAALANADNAEVIAKLTEEFGKAEEAQKAKDDELRKTKEFLVKMAYSSAGTKKQDEEEEDRINAEPEETVDDVLQRWANDPQGEYEKAKKKGF